MEKMNQNHSAKLLSIIIPAYNCAKYIEECLISIVNQSFIDYSIIIIDDLSTDETLSTVRNFSKNHLEIDIQIVESDSNCGPSETRQKGLDLCMTPYVTFVDSDDQYCSKNALLFMMNKMMETNADLTFCKYVTKHRFFTIRKCYTVKRDIMFGNEAMIEKYKSGNPIWHYLWNKIYKTNVIKDNKIQFKKGLKSAEDVLFNEDYLAYVCKVTFVNKYLYQYNCTNSFSLTKSTPQKESEPIKDWENCIQHFFKLIDCSKKQNCSEECRPLFLNMLACDYVRLNIGGAFHKSTSAFGERYPNIYTQISPYLLRNRLLICKSSMFQKCKNIIIFFLAFFESRKK